MRITLPTALALAAAAALSACSSTEDIAIVAGQEEAYDLGMEEGRRLTWEQLNGGLTEHTEWREPLLVRIPVPERRRGAVVIGPSDQVVVVRPGGWEERPPGGPPAVADPSGADRDDRAPRDW